jgi:transposase
MTQKERDRLVALKKAKKNLITQKQAAAGIGVSERQARRMLGKLRERGDKAVIHAARGRTSTRKIAEEKREKAIEILSQDVYRDFGPTLAAEYLAKKHDLRVGRETLRGWMIPAKLWRAKPRRVEKVHPGLLVRSQLEKTPGFHREKCQRNDLHRRKEGAQRHMLCGRPGEVEMVHRADHSAR